MIGLVAAHACMGAGGRGLPEFHTYDWVGGGEGLYGCWGQRFGGVERLVVKGTSGKRIQFGSQSRRGICFCRRI